MIMEDLAMEYDAEEVACDFSDWLVQIGYCDMNESLKIANEIEQDFYLIQEKAPKLFSLLRDISQ